MNFSEIEPQKLPSAWLDIANFYHNIQRVNQLCGDKKIRLATKSIRCVDALTFIAEKTNNFVGLMTYSPDETVFLLDRGFNNILCAYPTFNYDAIVATFDMIDEELCTVTWMVDSYDQWKFLNDIGYAHNRVIDVCLDINMSTSLPGLYFGTKRSPLIDEESVKDLLKKCAGFKNSRITGMMGYEAQIAGLPEQIGGKEYLSLAVKLMKTASKLQLSMRRQRICNLLRESGINLEFVNGGGSGSLEFTSKQPEVTEVTVGSAYYYPALFHRMESMKGFLPAAGFVLQVTRHPEPDILTCQSGGFIASGPAGVDKVPKVIWPENLEILQDEGFGEVQTPMRSNGPLAIDIGDYVWCQHAKAGELCEHFNGLYLYYGDEPVSNQLEQFWPTYRGEGFCFH